MLHIITDEKYTLAGFILHPLHEEKEVNIIQFSKKRKNFIEKAIRYFESKFFLVNGGLSLCEDTKMGLKKISKNDSILFFDIDYMRDIQLISQAIPKVKKKSIFLWNPLQTHDGKLSKLQRNLKVFKDLFDNVSTFDPVDAEKYNINLVAQPFLEIDLNKSERKIDIYFIGSDKGRLNKLIEIENMAKSQGLKCNFHITPSKRIDYSEEEKKYLKSFNISYPENIDIARDSKCLLEIVQENQAGPTMRSMEAAFLKCKLITNRKSAKHDVFYHPNNTLIIEDGTSYDFKSFLESEYVNFEKEIKETHSIKKWWHQFN